MIRLAGEVAAEPEEPSTVGEALSGPNIDKGQEAMDKEPQKCQKNGQLQGCGAPYSYKTRQDTIRKSSEQLMERLRDTRRYMWPENLHKSQGGLL